MQWTTHYYVSTFHFNVWNTFELNYLKSKCIVIDITSGFTTDNKSFELINTVLVTVLYRALCFKNTLLKLVVSTCQTQHHLLSIRCIFNTGVKRYDLIIVFTLDLQVLLLSLDSGTLHSQPHPHRLALDSIDNLLAYLITNPRGLLRWDYQSQLYTVLQFIYRLYATYYSRRKNLEESNGVEPSPSY